MRVREAAVSSSSSSTSGPSSGDEPQRLRSIVPVPEGRWFARGVRRWTQGRLDEAADALLVARSQAPADLTLLATQRSLQEYREARGRSCFTDEPSAPLQLLPAHPRFADGLHREGAGDEVAVRAGMPAWGSAEDAARWMAEFDRPPARLLGVAVHRALGVVGAASLRRAEDAALVAYFLGSRVHGRGWGRALVRATRAAASRAGVATLWAFVRPANAASLRALAVNGFVPAPFRAADAGGGLSVCLAGAGAGREPQALARECDALLRSLRLSWQLERPGGGR